MTTSLLEQKFDRVFSTNDINHNGYLTRDEITALSARVSAALGASPDKASRHLEAITGFWDHLAAQAGVSDRISHDEFRAAGVRAAGTPEFAEVITRLVHATHDLCDRDGDGYISLAEFETAHRASGAGGEVAATVFRRLDIDGDGRISRQETERAALEFYTSNDPDAPGNLLF